MSPSPLPLTSGRLLIDNSTLQEICACPRRAYYKYILRRQLVKPRAALFFGGAIHKALEARDKQMKPFICNETKDLMIAALIEEYMGTDLGSDYRNLDYAIQTIEKYNMAWNYDQHHPIMLYDKPAVELPFAVSIGNVTTSPPIKCCETLLPDKETEQTSFELVFTGKVDRITVHNGSLHLLDHKTSSIGGPNFFSEFFTSLQFRGYKFAMEHILQDKISGVIINALFCRPPLKSGAVNYTFDRQIIPIDDSLVSEWHDTFILIVQQWLKMVATYQHSDEQAFPLNTGSCVGKYGQCEYFDVCQLPVSQRHSLLATRLFEDHSWSPLTDSAKPKKTPEVNLDSLWQ